MRKVGAQTAASPGKLRGRAISGPRAAAGRPPGVDFRRRIRHSDLTLGDQGMISGSLDPGATSMPKPFKIFGIGLNKTGTTTLGACLTQLGYDHMSARRDLLVEVAGGRHEKLFQVCDRHESFEDWPYPLAYRELFARYGEGARFILTVRASPQAWLASLKAHAARISPVDHCRLLAYGYAYPHGFEAQHLAFYERHVAEVRAFFRAEGAEHLLKVLCWERGDGWAELCSFLDEAPPNRPFPHANSKAEARRNPLRTWANSRRISEQLRLLGRDGWAR